MPRTRPLSYEQERDRPEGEPPSNATRVMVSGEWIQFGIAEKRSVKHLPAPEPPKRLRGAELESWIRWNPPRRELVPSGVLELVATIEAMVLETVREVSTVPGSTPITLRVGSGCRLFVLDEEVFSRGATCQCAY
jgi:hypothetical protein